MKQLIQRMFLFVVSAHMAMTVLPGLDAADQLAGRSEQQVQIAEVGLEDGLYNDEVAIVVRSGDSREDSPPVGSKVMVVKHNDDRWHPTTVSQLRKILASLPEGAMLSIVYLYPNNNTTMTRPISSEIWKEALKQTALP